MDFRVLGSIEVVGAEGPAPLGGPKQRAVLAHLIVRANHIVPTDVLIDAVWPDDPPEAARGTLQAYVSNLRKVVGSDRIESRAPGYALSVDVSEVDAIRFERLVRDARRLVAEPARAAAVYREALALWRGPPFADLNGLRSLEGECGRLEELRLSALEERVAAELDAGRHNELVSELERLARDHPLRERFWAHLMLARYRAGRQGDALAAFDDARKTLSEELGVDPSPELCRLQERILRQDATLDLGGRPLRGYRLLERLGESALATVHRGLQPQVGREVAIKSIAPGVANNPEFVRRFEREAQLVARLEHPRVVPLYDFWRDSQGAHLVMRFLRAGSLRRRIDGEHGIAPEELAPILDQASEALAAAHRQGIVHRDVRPENILLDEDGNAYVSDFGVATVVGPVDVTAGMAERVAHLSPEQIRGEPATQLSDVYGFGVLVYQALTGRVPVLGGSPPTSVEQSPRSPLPSVLASRPDLPAGIDEVIERATATDPQRRFPDAPSIASAFRAVLGATALSPATVLPIEIRNPYKGLRAFDEADTSDFFGRESLTRRLVGRLGEDGWYRRFLAVVGPSGSGKSSVVNAGVVPALRGGALPGSDAWFYADATPGARPFEGLETALLRVAIDPPASLVELLEGGHLGLLGAVTRVLPPDGSELVLVIDQLEELFTLTTDERTRAAYLAALAAAATDPGSRLRVITCLRADFYDRPLLHPAFGELLGARTEAVTPMSPDELERAISGPAERVAVAPEPALIAAIVADVADEPGALPHLQYGLTELFERRREGSLQVAAYHELGGISGALAKRADELYGSLDVTGREACRQMFLRLTVLEEGVHQGRRRVTRGELDALEVDREALDLVIEAFGRHRLLSFDRDPVTRSPTVEVAHEALLVGWGRLSGWIDDARDDLRLHGRLAAAAREWEGSGRDHGFLLRGTRHVQFEAWSASSSVALATAERDLMRASADARDADLAEERARADRERTLERRSVRRMRAVVAILGAAALVASILTSVSITERRQAEAAGRVARARELAAAAEANLQIDPERSVLLALEAIATTREADGTVLPEAETALHRAIVTMRAVIAIPGAGPAVEFTADGDGLVVAEPDGRVTLRDRGTGEVLLVMEGHDGVVTSLDSSPDGRLLASGSSDETARVWDAVTGEPIAELVGHEDDVVGVEFAPDSATVATASLDGSVRIWDASTGVAIRSIRTWFRQGGLIFGYAGGDVLSFTPDGRRLAMVNLGLRTPAGEPPGAWVWDVASGEIVTTIGSINRFPHALSFSPDGSRLAIGWGDSSADLWDSASWDRVLTIPTGINAYDVAFGPDGETLAVASLDAETGASGFTIHELGGASAPERLTIHGVGAVDIAYSPEGATVAVGEDDGTVRLWNVSAEGSREVLTAIGPTGINGDVQFSPDGGILYGSTSPDGTVAAWDLATGEVIHTFDPDVPGAAVLGLAVNPDGRTLATANADRTVTLWETESGRRVRSLPASTRCPQGDVLKEFCPVIDVEFAPDGTWLATSAADGTARVFDSTTGNQLALFEGHEHLVFGIDISPDGRTLATASWDGTARLWDVTSEAESAVIDRRDVEVSSIAFDPLGSRIAVGGFDGVIKVFDSTGAEVLETLRGQGSVFDVAFSPDGRRLVTVGEAIEVWDLETGRRIFRLPGAANRATLDAGGELLATTNAPGDLVRVWALDLDRLIEIANDRLTRTFTADECRQYQIASCPRTN